LGRRKREEGRRKREEGRGKKEERRGKREKHLIVDIEAARCVPYL